MFPIRVGVNQGNQEKIVTVLNSFVSQFSSQSQRKPFLSSSGHPTQKQKTFFVFSPAGISEKSRKLDFCHFVPRWRSLAYSWYNAGLFITSIAWQTHWHIHEYDFSSQLDCFYEVTHLRPITIAGSNEKGIDCSRNWTHPREATVLVTISPLWILQLNM